jgi:hypothetical protein
MESGVSEAEVTLGTRKGEELSSLSEMLHLTQSEELLIAFQSLVKSRDRDLQFGLMKYAVMKKDSEFGVNEDIMRDMISVALGKKIVTMGKLAEKLNISYECLQTCVLLAGIKGKSKDKQIHKIQYLSRYVPFTSVLKNNFHVDPNRFLLILKMSFQLIKEEDLKSLIELFQIGEICREIVLLPIYYIYKAFNSLDKPDSVRKVYYQKLYTHGAPFFKLLGINRKIGTILVALFQGFYQV